MHCFHCSAISEPSGTQHSSWPEPMSVSSYILKEKRKRELRYVNYQCLESTLNQCKHWRDIYFNLSCFSMAEVVLPSRTYFMTLEWCKIAMPIFFFSSTSTSLYCSWPPMDSTNGMKITNCLKFLLSIGKAAQGSLAFLQHKKDTCGLQSSLTPPANLYGLF